jgi:flagellar protein FliS
MAPKIDLTYQRVAVQNASAIGITMLLYDRLVVDIQSAISAMQKGNIESRCAAINHGFLILQQLHANLNMDEGGETAQSLETFYQYIHSKLLEAQFKNSPELLKDQVTLILQVRAAWYEVESRESAMTVPNYANEPETVHPSIAAQRSSYNFEERPVSKWSA